MKKKAFITGITGQDGAYLAEFLLDKKYEVHGLKRRTSLFNTERIDHLMIENKNTNDVKNKIKNGKNFYLHHGDMTDSSSLIKIIKKIKPDEIYNLAAQSHVAVSFEMPEYSANVDGIGALRILESIRILGLERKTKFYQASTSELFGFVKNSPQNENTPFYPRSPYGAAKLYAHWITRNYREAYGLFACNGILFNHESPIRGETFVTRKITIGLSKVKAGIQKNITVGNLNAKRDWGHAKDYITMQWLMLQQKKPKDYVIATGRQYSVREFIELAASYLDIKIKWVGRGLNEVGIDIKTKKKIIVINKSYFRPAEVESLVGDSTKAAKELGWKPKISFKSMVKEMILSDYNKILKQKLI